MNLLGLRVEATQWLQEVLRKQGEKVRIIFRLTYGQLAAAVSTEESGRSGARGDPTAGLVRTADAFNRKAVVGFGSSPKLQAFIAECENGTIPWWFFWSTRWGSKREEIGLPGDKHDLLQRFTPCAELICSQNVPGLVDQDELPAANEVNSKEVLQPVPDLPSVLDDQASIESGHSASFMANDWCAGA